VLKARWVRVLHFILLYQLSVNFLDMDNEVRRIFIADDDPDILDILRLMLQTRGYHVLLSNDGSELFEYAEEELPDLVLLDIWMSGIDGRDICARLKKSENTKHIPVLFISANSNIQAITKECGAEGFIAKPFDMEMLLNKVSDLLALQHN
jgi:CheY-like chemotaxis protein